MNRYDVVIVGAGPSGLMTAKTLSENGFSVALLERKESITEITRACATMLAIEDQRYFNERMYLNDETKKIIFPETGFSVDYDGPFSPFYTWNMYSPDGNACVQLGDYNDLKSRGQRLSATYSKQHLLEMLLKGARDNGCHIFPGLNVVNVSRGKDSIKVYTHEGKSFEGTFVVAADGVNSRIARVSGLNKQRNFYGTMIGLGLYFNDCSIPYPEAFNWMVYYHESSRTPMALTMLPCPYPDAEFWLWGSFISSPPAVRESILDEALYMLNNFSYKHWFEKTEIVRHNCHVLNMWSPVPEPYLDNIIFVGDSAWTVEAECTGSMMCGLKAAHAITTAFRDNKINREGVKSYIDWWFQCFPDFEDYRGIINLFSLFEVMVEQDINYLFGLLAEKPLEPTLNPYTVSEQINGVIMQKIGQIQQENPQFMAKLQTAATVPLENIMMNSVRRAFPNR